MTKIDLKNLEKVSDYSIALIEEVMEDIKRLSKYSGANIGNNLDDVNNKIDLARANGVNVDKLDKQMLDFRVLLFNKDVQNLLEEIKTDTDKYTFDITRLELEYEELIKETALNKELLSKAIQELRNERIIAKIKFMIRNIGEGENHSAFTFDRIAEEISNAKDKGIDVSDIETMLFE